MPFDKDSFLKGVITGMRLPRTPGGKPPFEPVPSGKYILAEDGTNIVKENVVRDDVSIYDSGVWYDTETGTVRYRFINYHNENEYQCKIIFTDRYMYYFTDDPMGSVNRYEDRNGVNYYNGSQDTTYGLTRQGKKIYVQTQHTAPEGYFATPPKDAILITGKTRDEVLWICWDIWFGPTNPLITE